MVKKLKILVARLLVKIRNFKCECECGSEENISSVFARAIMKIE